MSYGGGTYNYYDKVMPGTYINYISQGGLTYDSTRGVVALGLQSDWGPDNEPYEFTAADFTGDAEKYTGHASTADENFLIREIFTHAYRIIAYKLNSADSTAAANEVVGTAKCTGSAGNKITVTCYQNVNNEDQYEVSTYFDSQLKDVQAVDKMTQKIVTVAKEGDSSESVNSPSATITAEQENKVVKVEYADLTESYPTTEIKVTKDGAKAETGITLDEAAGTVTFKDASVDGKYKVEATVKNEAGDVKTLKSTEITKTTTPETLKLEKGQEEEGEKVESETVTVDVKGLVATVTYSALPEEYDKLAVQVTKDGQPTTEKVTVDNDSGLAQRKATVTFEDDAAKGEYKIEARIKKTSEEDYKTTKTVTVTVATDTPVKYTYSKGEDTDGDTLDAPQVTFALDGKSISATYSDKYVDYNTTKVEVKKESEPVEKGYSLQDDGLVQTITFNEEIESGDYTIEAYLAQEYGDKKLIAKTTGKVTVDEEGTVGADASQLKSNDYVVFKSLGIIPAGAGYVFKGGKTGTTVTAGDHANLLTAFESRTFNVLVSDTNEKSVKELYSAFTKRMREDQGKYFQTVLHDYVEADHEGVISVYNTAKTTNAPKTTKKSSSVWWVAGYSSMIDLWNEMTNKRYDGELELDTNLPDVQLQSLYKKGHFLFHQVDLGEDVSLFDINTLTTYTEEHSDKFRENKVIRVIDYVHNAEASLINRNDIGRTQNTPEGRTYIWNECCTILNDLQSTGAITDFTSDELKVTPIEGDRHAVAIDQQFNVPGVIYRVYIKTIIL